MRQPQGCVRRVLIPDGPAIRSDLVNLIYNRFVVSSMYGIKFADSCDIVVTSGNSHTLVHGSSPRPGHAHVLE